MSNVGVAFKILERGENPPPGLTKSSGHMIYDVKDEPKMAIVPQILSPQAMPALCQEKA